MKSKTKAVIVLCILFMTILGLGYLTGFSGKALKTIPAFLSLDQSTGEKPSEASSFAIDTKKITIEPTPIPTPEPTVAPILKLVAVGDIMLGRSVGRRLEENPDGYNAAFSDVVNILKNGDVTFANFEAPITNSLHSLYKKNKIILKCSPASIDAVKAAGFDALSLANNHMMDYYDTGMYDTIALLNKYGIGHSGAGGNLDEARKPLIIEENGVKIGFISYTDMAYMYLGNPNINYAAGDDRAGVAPRKMELILEDLEKLQSQVDISAVSLHWGVEETFKITPEMVEFAHRLMDNGADIILGHHPHQFQGIEIYKGKPIIYSMGNFIFDQNDPENMETFILEIDYEKDVLTGLSAIPVRIMDKSRAVKQNANEAIELLSREISLCGELETICRIENDKLVFEIK